MDVPQVECERHHAGLSVSDVTAHKRMSLSSCDEEILLHTNEPLASYRFVE